MKSILFFIAAIAWTATILGGGGVFMSLRQTALRDAELDAAAHSQSIQLEVSDFLNQNLKAASILAALEPVPEWMSSGGTTPSDPVIRVLDLFRQRLDADACYLMNLEGTTVASSRRSGDSGFEESRHAFSGYFQSALLGEASVYMAQGFASRTRGVYTSQPVRNPVTHEIVGVAVIQSNLRMLENLIAHTRHQHTAKVFIVDPHGVIFLGENPEWLFRSLWPIDESDREVLRDSGQFGAGPLRWVGLQRTGDSLATAADGTDYHIVESAIPQYPGWNVVHLSNLQNLRAAAITPSLKTAGLEIVAVCLFTIGFLWLLFHFGRTELRRKNRLQKALSRQTEYLWTLHKLSLGMVGRLNLDDLLRSIVETLKRLSDADEVAIFMVDEQNGSMTFRQGVGPHLAVDPPTILHQGQGLVGKVWKTAEPLFVEDYRNWPHRLPIPGLEEMGATVAFPLVLRDTVFGVLLLSQGQEGRKIIKEDIAPLQQFADLAAVALDNATLVEKLQQALGEREKAENDLRDSLMESRRRQAEVEALLNGARAVMGYSSFEMAVRTLYRECRSIIGATAGYVSLLEENRTTHRMLCVDNGTDVCMAESTHPVEIRGLTAEVYRTTHTLFQNELIEKNEEEYFPEGTAGIDNILLAPIAIAGETMGLIALANKSKGFAKSDQRIAATFGELAALTLDNQRNVDALRRSERRFRTVLERIGDAVMVVDFDGRIRFANPAAEVFFGRQSGELEGTKFGLPITQADGTEIEIFKRDGTTGVAELRMVETDWEGVSVYFASLRDITERRRAEEDRRLLESQFRQVQKLEAIGTLAGGIAHDFNNILSAVIGFSQICMEQAEPESLMASNLEEVLQAGKRAKFLVQQILAFSRQSDVEMHPLMPKPLVKEVLKLIRASIPTTIDIRQHLNTETLIMADATQIHQVLMNLCTNSAHAMQESGGILTVALEDVAVQDADSVTASGLAPGLYVRISVADTGCGIDPAMMDRIFDPFFTTKDKGEGTGMGLAVVHGIVQEHGGTITVDSQMGKGARFDVFIPAATSADDREEMEERREVPKGTERILLVDDEAPIVKMIGHILGNLGYDVTTVTRSPEALARLNASSETFDLLITDMTMPYMTGKELAQRALAVQPDLKVILCTGFSSMITESEAGEIGISALVLKPILKDEFAVTVRRVLDERLAGSDPVGDVADGISKPIQRTEIKK